MCELHREMKNSLHEVSNQAGQTDRILSVSGRSDPKAYLSATRVIRALQEAWSLHLEIERALFPRLLGRNLLSAEFIKRISESNQDIEMGLEAILSAPWPRSSQAGLQSLRTGIRSILIRLLAQIEGERSLILPAIAALDRRAPAAICAEIEPSELVSI
jgi:hypothetical protein